MIVLDTLDGTGTRIRLAEPEDSVVRAASDMASVQSMLETLGLGEVELYGPESKDAAGEDPVDHSWSVSDGALEYHVSFPHALQYGALISRYTTVALATCGYADQRALSELRLSIYEMCMNILAHGVQAPEDGVIQISLRFEADRVVGWIQDECEHFDMSQAETDAVEEKVRAGARRGYGLLLIRRTLSDLRYERLASGNRNHFTKRMKP